MISKQCWLVCELNVGVRAGTGAPHHPLPREGFDGSPLYMSYDVSLPISRIDCMVAMFYCSQVQGGLEWCPRLPRKVRAGTDSGLWPITGAVMMIQAHLAMFRIFGIS